MSGKLSVTFFGGFRVHHQGELLTSFGYDKVKALFAYLMVEPGMQVERSVLAGLLWPEQPQENALHSMRQAIFQLRHALGEDTWEKPFILIDRTSIKCNPEADFVSDVKNFENLLIRTFEDEKNEIECLRTAIELYQGEFLKGFSLVQNESFEDWLFFRRDRYHRMVIAALEKVIGYYERQLDYEQARPFAEKWVLLEPWREEAHRELMLILAYMGERTLALKQYELCRKQLAEGFDLEPDLKTEELFQRIRSMGLLRSVLPNQTTPFIGRQEELGLLMGYLSDPSIRLITILGPGGIGKSRLAIQVGKVVSSHRRRMFLNGAIFVPLESISEPEHLISSIAQALSITFETGDDPHAQLIWYLRDKELLLILDNFEQLIAADSRNFLVNLLEETPGIKILVTSRQKLNLKSEHLLRLDGLKTPNLVGFTLKIGLEKARSYSSVEFLVSTLKRNQTDISFTQENVTEMVRICQLVEGMPLALELAASWSDSLSLKNIADEVQCSIDFLKSNVEDIPDRQKSIRAVIETSWRFLDDEERKAFMHLSVFKGGFTRSAAHEVVDASILLLSRLVNKSLIIYDPKINRYRIHELIRQYGDEKLALHLTQKDKYEALHAGYYSNYLKSKNALLSSDDEYTYLREIEIDLMNVIAAWKWSISRGEVDFIAQAAAPLYEFFARSSRFQEGATLFDLATQALCSGKDHLSNETITWILGYQGDLCARGGDWDAGRGLLQRSLNIIESSGFEGLDSRPIKAFVLLHLGAITLELEEARQLLQESLNLYRKLGDKHHVANALAYLGDLMRTAGELEGSRLLLEESLMIQRELGLIRVTIRTLRALTTLALRKGDLSEAGRLSQEVFDMAQNINDPDSLAASLEELGLTHIFSGRFSQAEACLKKSADIRLDLGQMVNISISHAYLSFAKCHLGKFVQANEIAQRSFLMADERGDLPASANLLLVIGMIKLSDGDFSEASLCFNECISKYKAGWQHDARNRRAIALALLAWSDCHRSFLGLAREHLMVALRTNMENNSYIGLLHSLSAIALLYGKEGKAGKSVDIYELAKSHHFIANSALFEKLVGRHIDEFTTKLPLAAVEAAKRSGQTRDLWVTASELLDELEREEQ
jgi:predicted ATPase/DNA-binding SARP family transcriptional activator/tetratricopeptide (TPR) repeat protein